MGDRKKSHPRQVIDLTEDDSDSSPDAKRPRTAENSAAAGNQSSRPTANAAKSPTTHQRLVQAAARGQRDRLYTLLRHFEGDLTEATVAAASKGHYDCVATLRDNLCDPDDDECHVSIEGRECMRDAVGPAARNGHAEVVEFLLTALRRDGEPDETATLAAFHQAVGSGHLDVVKVATDYLPTYNEDFDEHCNAALSAAVSRGYAEVVAFLLAWEECTSDVCSVFEDARQKGKHEVAERIYEAYAELNKGKNLFVEMAGKGRTDAVKYMVDHGNIDANLLRDALARATASDCTVMIEFLQGDGRFSS